MKTHILIVEDEPALYERMRRALSKYRFTIDEYTKSFDEAISRIKNERPDIVLLDIDLQGKKDGIDLGKVLHTEYNIPFIYVTNSNDDTTFQQGLHTNHEQYIVKTKPRLNIEEVVRAIHTALHKQEENSSFTKDGVMGLVDYLEEIKSYGKGDVTRVPINYSDIAFFTITEFINNDEQEEKLRDNYLWFQTRSKPKDVFFLKSSLKDMEKVLPDYFVRVNKSHIVNILSKLLDGRINGSRLSIMGTEILINNSYSKELKKRLDKYYHS